MTKKSKGRRVTREQWERWAGRVWLGKAERREAAAQLELEANRSWAGALKTADRMGYRVGIDRQARKEFTRRQPNKVIHK